MKSVGLNILFFAVTTLGVAQNGAVLNKAEAQKAFTLLNKIRTNMPAYAAELTLPDAIEITNTALVWNDTLAKVAETKALDMAKRNYFAHVDPNGYGMNYYINKAGYKLATYYIKTNRANAFESISAGFDTGEETIKSLIIDKNTPGLGHRKHLLGMDGYQNARDIGIGFVTIESGADYTTYVSIIIAMHK